MRISPPLFLLAFLAFLIIADAVWDTHLSRTAAQQEKGFCDSLYATANQSCSLEYENRLYDGGDTNYPRADHVKDIPLCDRIAKGVFHACEHYGESDAKTDSRTGIPLPGKGDEQ